MSGLTRFLSWKVWAAAVAALGLLLGLQTLRLADEQRDHSKTAGLWSKDREAWEKAAREAAEDARAEEQRRTTAVQEIADETQKKLEVARADADAARDAGERLRQRVAQLTAALGSAAAGKPTAAGSSAPADTTADLLADVQLRVDEATDTIAEFADRAHTAGLGCEHSYNALTTPNRGGLGLKR